MCRGTEGGVPSSGNALLQQKAKVPLASLQRPQTAPVHGSTAKASILSVRKGKKSPIVFLWIKRVFSASAATAALASGSVSRHPSRLFSHGPEPAHISIPRPYGNVPLSGASSRSPRRGRRHGCYICTRTLAPPVIAFRSVVAIHLPLKTHQSPAHLSPCSCPPTLPFPDPPSLDVIYFPCLYSTLFIFLADDPPSLPPLPTSLLCPFLFSAAPRPPFISSLRPSSQ